MSHTETKYFFYLIQLTQDSVAHGLESKLFCLNLFSLFITENSMKLILFVSESFEIVNR